MPTLDSTIVLAAAQGVLSIVAVLIGWLMRGLFARMEKMEAADAKLADEVTALRVALPTLYVTKAEHKDQLDNIFAALRRIEDLMQRKVDKP
jgi:hypothetical protein